MKAISLAAPGQVGLVDVPEPQLGPEDLLLQVQYVGLCGSDLGMYRGTFPLGTYPRIPGHEVSGTILTKGENVPDAFNLGDRVTVYPYSECGICPACRLGRPNCCQFSETLGLQRDGALMRRFAVRYSKVFSSQILSTKELALVEPMSVGYHAANRGRVTELDTVLIVGCGTIGLGAIAAAVRKGATVIATDIAEAKLAQACSFGAQHAVNSEREDVLEASSEVTAGEGVSVAVEAVGLPETFRLAVEAVAYGGRVVYIGYAEKEVCYDTTCFVRKELDIMGSRNALRVFPAVITLLEARQHPFEGLVTKTYPFTETPHALRDWSDNPGAFTKILIEVTPDCG